MSNKDAIVIENYSSADVLKLTVKEQVVAERTALEVIEVGARIVNGLGEGFTRLSSDDNTVTLVEELSGGTLYYDLAVTDYISATEVANVSGDLIDYTDQLRSDTASATGDLQTQIDNLDNNIGGIPALITLQNAYDNGNTIIHDGSRDIELLGATSSGLKVDAAGDVSMDGDVDIDGDVFVGNRTILDGNAIHVANGSTTTVSGVHIDAPNRNGSRTTGGIVFSEGNSSDRRLYFTGKDGIWSFKTGSYSADTGILQMSKNSVGVAANMSIGKSGTRVVGNRPQNVSLRIQTDTDNAPYVAEDDLDAFVTYFRTQSGGDLVGSTGTNGGDLVITLGDGQGTGVKGRLIVNDDLQTVNMYITGLSQPTSGNFLTYDSDGLVVPTGINETTIVTLFGDLQDQIDDLSTELVSVSGDLKQQIDAIVPESTSIASSGGTILVTQTGFNFNLEAVYPEPILDHNELQGLQGGSVATSAYFHLSEEQFNDYIGETEVAEISGNLKTQIDSISGSVDSITESISGDFVLKSGDTMTGQLEINAGGPGDDNAALTINIAENSGEAMIVKNQFGNKVMRFTTTGSGLPFFAIQDGVSSEYFKISSIGTAFFNNTAFFSQDIRIESGSSFNDNALRINALGTNQLTAIQFAEEGSSRQQIYKDVNNDLVGLSNSIGEWLRVGPFTVEMDQYLELGGFVDVNTTNNSLDIRSNANSSRSIYLETLGSYGTPTDYNSITWGYTNTGEKWGLDSFDNNWGLYDFESDYVFQVLGLEGNVVAFNTGIRDTSLPAVSAGNFLTWDSDGLLVDSGFNGANISGGGGTIIDAEYTNIVFVDPNGDPTVDGKNPALPTDFDTAISGLSDNTIVELNGGIYNTSLLTINNNNCTFRNGTINTFSFDLVGNGNEFHNIVCGDLNENSSGTTRFVDSSVGGITYNVDSNKSLDIVHSTVDSLLIEGTTTSISSQVTIKDSSLGDLENFSDADVTFDLADSKFGKFEHNNPLGSSNLEAVSSEFTEVDIGNGNSNSFCDLRNVLVGTVGNPGILDLTGLPVDSVLIQSVIYDADNSIIFDSQRVDGTSDFNGLAASNLDEAKLITADENGKLISTGINATAVRGEIVGNDTAIYSVTHDESNDFPVVSLVLPSADTEVMITGIRNITSTGFEIVLSHPIDSLYKLQWQRGLTAIQDNTIQSFVETVGATYTVLNEDLGKVLYSTANQINLPAGAIDGNNINIKNKSGSSAIVNGNGNNIEGFPTTAIVQDESLTFHFFNGEWNLI